MRIPLSIPLIASAIFIVAGMVMPVFGQPPQISIQPEPTTDEQLASGYYQSGDYEKAAVYYEKLYAKTPISIYYTYYLNCLIFTKEYRKAEKLIKKHAARHPGDLRFKVDLGRVYRAEGAETKALKEFNGAINSITSTTNANDVIDLANSFLGINEADLAIAALQKGRKELNGSYAFHIELAEIYSFKKDFASMVNEYLDLLALNDKTQKQVRDNLQAKMDADAEDKIEPALKTELIRRSQKDPDKIIWPEMLMWLYMQQKNFSSALIQAKAVDKRQKLEGEQVMELAETARANHAFDAATDAYDYVISLGTEKFNYRRARMEKVNTRFEKITASNYSQADLQSLEVELTTTLDEMGKDSRTVPLMRTLSSLKAFYLHNTKDAIHMLEQAIGMPGITSLQQAE
ncbi:MAG TPA: hypothetical protein VI731_10330, partial [Bacteroidia bacterium]|nr:hypothetical protein [Bacteroidia bacterium]